METKGRQKRLESNPEMARFINFQNAVLDGTYRPGWLVDEEPEEVLLDQKPLVLSGTLEIDPKKILSLSKTPRFEVYMGRAADDIEAVLDVARKQRLRVSLLDTPEEWGYQFLVIETRKLHLRKKDSLGVAVDLRINPLEPLVLGKGREEEDSEFTVSLSDLNPDALDLEDFGNWNKIPEIQWPTEIRLQVSSLS